ncbi:MAG: hypothetical protein ACRYGK_00435, partial [Janthinobacterium lividum]
HVPPASKRTRGKAMNSKQKRGWRRHILAQLASVTTKDLAEAYAESMKKMEQAQDYIKQLEGRIAELEQVSAADAARLDHLFHMAEERMRYDTKFGKEKWLQFIDWAMAKEVQS